MDDTKREFHTYFTGLLWGVLGTLFICCASAGSLVNLIPNPAIRLTITMAGIFGMVGVAVLAGFMRRRSGWAWNNMGISTGFLLVAIVYLFAVFANVLSG